MSWSKMLGKTAVGLVAVAVPVVFALAGAGQASADPGFCVTGPFGYASACLNAPGWVNWAPGWGGDWGHGWHGGDGDWDEWEGDD